MKMTVTAIRLPADLLAKLRALGHRESLRTNREITWSALVRRAAESLVKDQGGEEPAAAAGDDPAPCPAN